MARSQQKSAMELPLPENILNHVREFSSDRVGIHPTAKIIKDLSFEYMPEENKYGWGIFKPRRLTVTTAQGYFTQIWNLPDGHIANQPFREYYFL